MSILWTNHASSSLVIWRALVPIGSVLQNYISTKKYINILRQSSVILIKRTYTKITYFLHLIMKSVIYLSPSIYVLISAAEMQVLLMAEFLISHCALLFQDKHSWKL